MNDQLIAMLAERAGVTIEEFRAKMAEKAVARERGHNSRAQSGEGPPGPPTFPAASYISFAQARSLVDQVPPLPNNPLVEGIYDPEVILSSNAFELLPGGTQLDDLHLTAEGNALIVNGDLTVNNILVQDFRAGCLLVLGNLHAKHIVTTGQLQCTGGMHVSGTMFGNCTNYSTDVWGKTSASVVISAKEHYFCFWGGWSIDSLYDLYGDTPNLEGADVNGVEPARAALNFDDIYDERQALAALRAHDTLLA